MPFKCYQHEELKMPLFDVGSFVTKVHALHPWFYFCVQGEKKRGKKKKKSSFLSSSLGSLGPVGL